MLFDILTLFPDFFTSPLNQSIVRRAQESGIIRVRTINLRDFAVDRHQVTDDRPFGGGPGMVLKIEPLVAALNRSRAESPQVHVVLLTPQGTLFKQATAIRLAQKEHILLVCGHYEGIDDRVRFYIDEEISLGDYILTGGEIPALALIDAVTRLLPGSIGGEGATEQESFQDNLLEYPQYTRPRVFDQHGVPEILLSGDHKRIADWRRQEALRRTRQRRAELLQTASLSPEDVAFLATLEEET